METEIFESVGSYVVVAVGVIWVFLSFYTGARFSFSSDATAILLAVVTPTFYIGLASHDLALGNYLISLGELLIAIAFIRSSGE